MTGEVTDQIILFSMILMRMSGFVLLNPVLGRRGIPGMIKAGMIMILTIMIYPISEITGRVPVMALELVLCLLKEFAIGYLIGFIMQLFDYVVTFAGSLIDFHMGLSMASVYDPASGAQVALTGSVLNIYYILLFLVSYGHLALMKILVTSADVVPYGQIAFGPDVWNAMLVIFAECTVLAVKLAFPLIAIEFLTEMGIGILMKIVPQMNLFVLNIQIKVLMGLAVIIFFISPIGDYFGRLITQMMDTMQEILRLTAG